MDETLHNLTKMTDFDSAVLINSNEKEPEYSKININKQEFVIGRSKTASFIIRSLLVSKSQCVFKKRNEDWTICDKSSFGTFLNGKQVEKDVPVKISDGDKVDFGPTGRFKYVFYTKETYAPPKKKMRVSNEDVDDLQLLQQDTQERETEYRKRYEGQEKRQQQRKSLRERLQSDSKEQEKEDTKGQISEEKLLQEKKVLEDKVKEMQRLLEEKEMAQEMLNKKLEEKEEERKREIKLLQEQKDEQVRQMMENLKKEVTEREKDLRNQLENEIKTLEEEKKKLENEIKGELSNKLGQTTENLKHMEEELEKISNNLVNMERKKQYLEDELEKTTKAKEDASESCLKAKQEVLQNFGDLMENELQCSICNELFVTAITLNCTHTFCKFCIQEWKKKKKECPVCRARITSENRSIALDNFIDRMVSNLSEEIRNRRQETIEERQVQDLLGPKPKAKPAARQNRRQRRERRQNVPSSSSSDNPSQGGPVIVLDSSSSSTSSSSSSSSSSSLTSSDSELDSEMEAAFHEDHANFMQGLPGSYYGGYGYCYHCGRRGHWAGGCPDRQ